MFDTMSSPLLSPFSPTLKRRTIKQKLLQLTKENLQPMNEIY